MTDSDTLPKGPFLAILAALLTRLGVKELTLNSAELEQATGYVHVTFEEGSVRLTFDQVKRQ